MRASAHIVSVSDQFDRLAVALGRAGWTIRREASSEISLVVHGAGTAPEMAAYCVDILRAAVRIPGLPRARGADLDIVLGQPVETVAHSFAQWLPPPPDSLERLADTFGRPALARLVTGIRTELRSSVLQIDDGGRPDAHKLVALTGTIGFAQASEAWRRVDELDGQIDEARRETRKAIVAISAWLAATT